MEPNDIIHRITQLAGELNDKSTAANHRLTAANVLVACEACHAKTPSARELYDLVKTFRANKGHTHRHPATGQLVKEGVSKNPMPITLDDSVKLAVGAELIDVEYQEDGVCDCGPEVTLHFNNGQEISVYVHPEMGVVVEGD